MSKQVVLGIESSCDETAAAVLIDGELKSNEISSQIDIHRRFGGVVPEVASRNHLLGVLPIVDGALKKAGVTKKDITAIGVTYGAGLIGALLVGVSAAKALSYALNVPLVKVNHIEGHICANYIDHPELKPPFIAIVASGGHTSIVDVSSYNDYNLIGSTTDDAIGEAFDKVARVLGLPYPGGPVIDSRAKNGNANIQFINHKGRKDYALSYSGLKTAVINYMHTLSQRGEECNIDDVCASFQTVAVDMLVDTAIRAAKDGGYKTLVLCGGVAANSYLRASIAAAGASNGIKTLYPKPILCTDNAAMIAMRAYLSLKEGKNIADLTLNAVSNLRVSR